MTNLDTFVTVYGEELAKAIAAFPDEYSSTPVETVLQRMSAALKRGTYNKDGRAFKATCKRLGLKHTYTEIGEYLNG